MDPNPDAVLLRRARQALGLSAERVVERLVRIKMSGTYWRQIENGRHAPDDTIAHMYVAVGVTPEQVIKAGRSEAAEILREIQRQEAAANSYLIDDLRDDSGFMKIWRRLRPEQQEQALQRAEEFQRRIEEEQDRAREQKERAKSDLVRYVEALATPGESGA